MARKEIVLLSAVVLLFAVAGYGKEPKPAKEKKAPAAAAGFHAQTLHLTPLEGEIPDVGHSSLRMRLITVEPGGHTALHVHENRPGIVYVVSGAIYNHPKGQEANKVQAGEVFCETQGYTHYIENRGKVSATLLSADIVTKDGE